MENKKLQDMTREELESLTYNLLCEKADLSAQVYEDGEKLEKLQEELSAAYDEIDAWKTEAEEQRKMADELADLLVNFRKKIDLYV